MIFGVAGIVLLRIVVKNVCRVTLPPLIRFSAETFGVLLPRRHYRPATEYGARPLEALRAVPSVIDLPDTFTPNAELGQKRMSWYLSTGSGVHRGSGDLSPTSPGSSRATSPNPLYQQHRMASLNNLNGSTDSGLFGQDRPTSPGLLRPTSPGIIRSSSPTPSDHIAEQLADALSKKARSRKDKAKGQEAPGVERYDADGEPKWRAC